MTDAPRPTVGRIVQYTLSEQDARVIHERRTRLDLLGNSVAEGDVYPMTIVRVWGDAPGSAVNGQVHLDGQDTHWVTSAEHGEGPRHWSWPVIT